MNNDQHIIKTNKKNTTIRIKQLTKRISFNAGRNFGLITSTGKKSFKRRVYRFLNFKRNDYKGYSAIIRSIDYDSFRNSHIALICYPFGLLQYVLLTSNLQVGSEIKNYGSSLGDSIELNKLKNGSIVCNLGLYNNSCGKLIRSAGTSAILIRNSNNFSLIKLKSGELRLFNDKVMCVKGSISNSKYFLRDLKKAGTAMKLLNKRPRNRALARNPVDHPMGGRTKGGVSLNPKGQYSKWTPSVNVNKISKYRILTKRKNKLINF
jgi:large subunit ribosomal protein L2